MSVSGRGILTHGLAPCTVVPEMAEPWVVADARRLILRELVYGSRTEAQVQESIREACWLPHLRFAAPIQRLEALVPSQVKGDPCEPQIVIAPPHDGPEPEISFHLDQEPPWAGGRRYRSIVGVALTRTSDRSGALVVQIDGETVPIPLAPGSAVILRPDTPHSPGVNLSDQLRLCVYFRYLKAA